MDASVKFEYIIIRAEAGAIPVVNQNAWRCTYVRRGVGVWRDFRPRTFDGPIVDGYRMD